MTDHALPRIDEPAVVVAATPEDTWEATVAVLASNFGSRHQSLGARVLGCRHVRLDGSFPSVGTQVPGFVVTESTRPTLLALDGRHRTSVYSLTFRITADGAGTSRLAAETRAAFPGPVGRLYRAAVIGSGMHARLMASLLNRIRSAAEG